MFKKSTIKYYGKLLISTEQLEVYDNGDIIIFDDINDTHLSIEKSNIRRISVSEDAINSILTIDTCDSKLSFVVSK